MTTQYQIEHAKALATVSDYTLQMDRTRKALVDQYSWAIPNMEAIQAIVACGPIIEVGCGSGYWAHEIRKAGGTIVPTDVKVGDNFWYKKLWLKPIEMDGVAAAKKWARTHTLLIIWPHFSKKDGAWCEQALTEYRKAGGRKVIYIGEGMYGWTGTEYFHLQLQNEWNLSKSIDIPVWPIVHDGLNIYDVKPEFAVTPQPYKERLMNLNLQNLPDPKDMSPEQLSVVSEAFVDDDDPKVLNALQKLIAGKLGFPEPTLFDDESPWLYQRLDNDEVAIEVERLIEVQSQMGALMARINKGTPMVEAAFAEYTAGKQTYYDYKARFTAYRATPAWEATPRNKQQAIWDRYKRDQTATYTSNGEKLGLAKKLKSHLSNLWDQWKALRDTCTGLNPFIWAEYFSRVDGKTILVDNEGLNATSGDTTDCDDMLNLNMSQAEALDYLVPEIEPEYDNN